MKSAPGGHREHRRPAHVVEGPELAGLEDHLEVRVPAGLADRDDLLEHRRVVAGEECAAVDDHVDLVGPGRDGGPRLGELDVEERLARGERRRDATRP